VPQSSAKPSPLPRIGIATSARKDHLSGSAPPPERRRESRSIPHLTALPPLLFLPLQKIYPPPPPAPLSCAHRLRWRAVGTLSMPMRETR
jgi:hypothetical protein